MKKQLMLVPALLTAVAASLPSATQAAALPRAASHFGALPSYVEKARRDVVIVRPGPRRVFVVRPWRTRPYYGTLIGGIALGSLLAASYYYSHPAPPGPGLCWYWSSPSHTRGYWDYCD